MVYCNRIREAYGSIPIGIGGVEASLRRFAHYDYWDDRVRNSILVDSGADVLMFGMGEKTILRVAEWMKEGRHFSECDIPGTCVMTKDAPEDAVVIESAEEVMRDKKAYARAFLVQYNEQDPVRGKRIAQKHGARYLLQNKPAMPLVTEELDKVYARRTRGRGIRCTTRRAAFRAFKRWNSPSPPERGMLRRVQFLRAHVPSGAHRHLPEQGFHRRGGEKADCPAGLQGLYSRRGRPDGELPSPGLRQAAEIGHVSAETVPVSHTL